MGQVTPGRPIRRHCHYKHPSGKGKGTDRAGDKQTPTERVTETQRRLAGAGPPAYPGLLTYCASAPLFPPGITGCEMAPWAVGWIKREERGSVAISAGIRVARKRASSPVRPLVCRPCLSSSWVSQGKLTTAATVLYPQGVQCQEGRIVWGLRKVSVG